MARIKMKPLDFVAYLLVSIGALNWGLVEALNFNIVETLLGFVGFTAYALWIYLAVGVAGAYSLYKLWF